MFIAYYTHGLTDMPLLLFAALYTCLSSINGCIHYISGKQGKNN